MPSRDLGQVLSDRVQELIVRSSRVTRRSAILIESSRHHRERETLVPHCAWCGKVQVGGYWTLPQEVPAFLAALLEERGTHAICPTCFTELERHSGDAAPLPRSSVLIHADGPLAAECMRRALQEYPVRERPDFLLEATLPDAGGGAVSALLSTVSRCLAQNVLAPVTIELADRTYVLGDEPRAQEPAA